MEPQAGSEDEGGAVTSPLLILPAQFQNRSKGKGQYLVFPAGPRRQGAHKMWTHRGKP